jgi:hypothetical protein
MQWIRDILEHLLLGALVLTAIVVAVISALRSANDREVLLRGLPPPSALLSLRLAHLRRNARRQARQQMVVALRLGIIVAIGGSLVAVSQHPVTFAGFAAAALVATYWGIGWLAIASVVLMGRYLGARQRIVLEAHDTSLPIA